MKEIRARYAGQCRGCGRSFGKGTLIKWGGSRSGVSCARGLQRGARAYGRRSVPDSIQAGARLQYRRAGVHAERSGSLRRCAMLRLLHHLKLGGFSLIGQAGFKSARSG